MMHVCVWAYTFASEAVLFQLTDNLFICVHPWTTDGSYTRLAFLCLPFLLIAAAIIRVSRHIGRLRRTVSTSLRLEAPPNMDEIRRLARENRNAQGHGGGDALDAPLLDVAAGMMAETEDNDTARSLDLDLATADATTEDEVEYITRERGLTQEEIDDPESEAFRRLATQVPEVPASRKARDALHGTIARFVLVLYVLVCLLCLVLSLLLHAVDGNNAVCARRFALRRAVSPVVNAGNQVILRAFICFLRCTCQVMIFEIRFLAETMSSLVSRHTIAPVVM